MGSVLNFPGGPEGEKRPISPAAQDTFDRLASSGTMPGIPLDQAKHGMVIEGDFDEAVLDQYLESLMFDGRSGGIEYRSVGLIPLRGIITADANPALLENGLTTNSKEPLRAAVTFEPVKLMGARDRNDIVDREGTWNPKHGHVLPQMSEKEVRFRGAADIYGFEKKQRGSGEPLWQPVDQLPLYEPAYLTIIQSGFRLVTRPADRPEPEPIEG